MDIAAAVLGFLTGFLGLVLAGLSLWSRIIKGIKEAATEVLVDSGLIRYGGKDNWPNGWDNLPDALHGIDKTQKWLVEQEEKRRGD